MGDTPENLLSAIDLYVCKIIILHSIRSEAYIEPSWTSTMETFHKNS